MTESNERASGLPWNAGLRWAFAMAGLQLIEAVALGDIVFVDRPHGALSWSGNPVVLYFWLVALTFAGQVLGILLVVKGHYRVGGAIQIASSLVHLLKVEGVIGIIGGAKAWQYGKDSGDRPLGSP